MNFNNLNNDKFFENKNKISKRLFFALRVKQVILSNVKLVAEHSLQQSVDRLWLS